MTYPIATSPIQSLARGAEPAPVSSLGCLRPDAGGRTDVDWCLTGLCPDLAREATP